MHRSMNAYQSMHIIDRGASLGMVFKYKYKCVPFRCTHACSIDAGINQISTRNTRQAPSVNVMREFSNDDEVPGSFS